MAAPSHRYQSSLEGIIDFSESAPIFENEQQRDQAIGRFRRIVEYLEAAELPVSRYGQGYNRPALVRLTYEYARSPKSKDKFLEVFFKYLALRIVGNNGVNLGIVGDNGVNLDISGAMAILGPRVNSGEVASLGSRVFDFADQLINHFFLPLRASTCKTPQPTPPHQAAIQQVHSQEEQQRIQDFVGTPERLGTLRGLCLARDRHRCVVTRHFDWEELDKRTKQPAPKDDDGNDLHPGNGYDYLEVAHIIPFSLTKGNNDSKLNDSQRNALLILNMFDIGVVHLIEGIDIDRPRNAITLTQGMHQRFGRFKIYFERPANTSRDTYDIRAFDSFTEARLGLPIRRTFFNHPTIDPPSEQLLALHRAIGHILHFSAAGDYIDKILRDMEDGVVREDGSTQLGAMVQVALQIKG